jgi:hypothetical protein
MDYEHGLSPGVIVALKSFFIFLAFVAVTLRLVANWKYSRKLLIDDCEVSSTPKLGRYVSGS